MAIDPTKGSFLSLADAARTLPRRRGGKKPHVSCIYRWTTRGCKGVIRCEMAHRPGQFVSRGRTDRPTIP